jgi:hypothetical protein
MFLPVLASNQYKLFMQNDSDFLPTTFTLQVLSTLEQENFVLKAYSVNWQASFNPRYCITKVIYISFVVPWVGQLFSNGYNNLPVYLILHL